MPGINTILIATDLSKGAGHAECRAAMLAREHACATVELIAVKESAQPDVMAQIMHSELETAVELIRSRTEQALRDRAASLKESHGVACSHVVRFGMPAGEIVARAEEVAADLIVAGAHGGNFFSRFFLGNTADRLAHLCKRPLLVVKNEPERAYRNLLVPVDFSEDARSAARLAMQVAPDAAITFLHVCEIWYEGALHYANIGREAIEEYRFREDAKARLALNQFIGEIGAEHLPVKHAIKFGMPAAVIRDYAEQHRPDLIVMGKHGRSRLEALLLGSVSRDTLEQTGSDILIAATDTQAA